MSDISENMWADKAHPRQPGPSAKEKSVTLELYNFPQSTCSQKVRLTLWERQIEFTDRPVDSTKREHLSDWYLKLNPNGVVPTLIHDGAVIIDSSVIMEYLEDVFPDRAVIACRSRPPGAYAQMASILRRSADTRCSCPLFQSIPE